VRWLGGAFGLQKNDTSQLRPISRMVKQLWRVKHAVIFICMYIPLYAWLHASIFLCSVEGWPGVVTLWVSPGHHREAGGIISRCGL